MRKETFQTGEFYHIYNRGVDKRITFMNDLDRRRFITSLIAFNEVGRKTPYSLAQQTPWKIPEPPLVNIHAYCLMPNHFHLLLEQLVENGISEFMHRIGTGFTNYFNIQQERSGALFEGPYKSILVTSDEYLLHLTRYIHLNPLELIESNWKTQGIQQLETAIKFLEIYPWSSYKIYLQVDQQPFVKTTIRDQWFQNSEDYRQFTLAWAVGNLQPIEGFILE